MALFTVLLPEQLAEICDAYDLGRVVATGAIAAGTINSNYSLQTERGRYFLRVNEGKTLDDVAWEAQVVEWLARHRFPTPAPVASRQGNAYLCWRDKILTVFPWSEGAHLEPSEVTEAAAAALGGALGMLHRLGATAPPTWMRPSIYGHEHLAQRYDAFRCSEDRALGPAIAWLGEAIAFVERHAAVRARSARTLVHGDLFRDNVLWRDGELAAVLDFEQASAGTAAYDIAVCLNDWCWDGGPNARLAAALVSGYQRQRPLTPEDRAALPIEVRAAAMRFTITRITDVYLARVDNPEKDFRDFLARLEAWQSPLLGEFLAAV